jgi:hypothetical protein
MVGVLAVSLLITVAGCGGGTDEPAPVQSIAELIATIMQATPNPVTPEQVAEAFALGSDSTDLQRDLIEKDLVGSVVEWDILVYEVSYADGRYKVTSQPIPIASADAIQLTRVVALIQAQSNEDDDLLRAVKTDDVLRIRGLVQDIVLRTVVKIGPAVVMPSREVPSIPPIGTRP